MKLTVHAKEQPDNSIAVTMFDQRGKRVGRAYLQRGLWQREIGPLLAALGHDIRLGHSGSSEAAATP